MGIHWLRCVGPAGMWPDATLRIGPPTVRSRKKFVLPVRFCCGPKQLDDRKSRARGASCARQTVSLDTVTALALAAALPRSSGRATRANYCSFLAHACHTCELTLWNLRSWLLMSAQDWRIALTNAGLHRASAESHLVGLLVEALAPRRCRQSHQGDDEAQHQRVDEHHRQLVITGRMHPGHVPSINVVRGYCINSYIKVRPCILRMVGTD